MKKITAIIIGVLFVWFTLDITGFVVGNFTLVVSAFKDEPIDILWWAIFLVGFILFIFKDKIGKYFMLVFLAIWGLFIQAPIYFGSKEQIAGYNNFFSNERTHRLIPASNSFVIKDTYHIFLDLFILISLGCVIIFTIQGFKNRRAK